MTARPWLELPQPHWHSLAGGTGEDAWLADRDRKMGFAAELGKDVSVTYRELQKRGALFTPNVKVLREVPFSADWYVSLAGFAMKTLSNVRAAPMQFGLNRLAKGLVETHRENRARLTDSDLQAFAAWIDDELDRLYPSDSRDEQLALVAASMIFGGRIIGQGQNAGGDLAVTLFKTLLVGELERRGSVQVVGEGGDWLAYRPEHNLPEQRYLRFDDGLQFELISGGDRPDVMAFVRKDRLVRGASPKNWELVAVGEIKGRKDESNAWESWMPQVDSHMREWATSHPRAARVFLGTLISRPMVDGISFRGTDRPGLKQMYHRGDMNGAYNLSKIADREASALAAFDAFVSALVSLAGE